MFACVRLGGLLKVWRAIDQKPANFRCTLFASTEKGENQKKIDNALPAYLRPAVANIASGFPNPQNSEAICEKLIGAWMFSATTCVKFPMKWSRHCQSLLFSALAPRIASPAETLSLLRRCPASRVVRRAKQFPRCLLKFAQFLFI
jgi:hypothetical protein